MNHDLKNTHNISLFNRIQVRALLAPLLILTMLGGALFAAILNFENLFEEITYTFEQTQLKKAEVSEIKSEIISVQSEFYRILNLSLHDLEKKQLVQEQAKIITRIEIIQSRVKMIRAQFLLSEPEDFILRKIEKTLNTYLVSADKAAVAIVSNLPIANIFMVGLEQSVSKLSNNLDSLLNLTSKVNLSTTLKNAEDFKFVIISAFIFTSILSVVILLIAFTRIARAIVEITISMNSIAIDEDNVPLPAVHRQDEIGQMARALTVFRNNAIKLHEMNKQLTDEISIRKETENALTISQSSLMNAQRIANLGSWELDLKNNKLQWSDQAFRIFEVEKNDFGASYQAFIDLVHPNDRELLNMAFRDSIKNKTSYDIEHRLLMNDGRIKYIHETGETLYDTDGKPEISHGTVQDITERVLAEKQINLDANVFRYSTESILITDNNNKIVAVNPSLTKLTGYTAKELIGENPSILSSGQTPKAIFQEMWKSLSEKGHWQGELSDKRKDGTIYPKWLSISKVVNNDTIVNYIGTFTDITERKASEEKISHLAHHDVLTGLLNRYSLKILLEQELVMSKRNKEQLAVLFIDMDRFKIINDTLGHHIGDTLLIKVAERLKLSIRESDIVARLGGDEFVVVLNNIGNIDVAAEIAYKIVNDLGKTYEIGKYELNSTPSIGISIFPTDGNSVDLLMKNSDTAMYHAKEQGRNNYQFYTEEMNIVTQKRHTLERDLRRAISNKQFELYYQPKITVKTSSVSGVEALIRWNHPDHGMVPPNEFIPVAEETGLIEEIGEWVIAEACQQLSNWKSEGVELKMAVNLSPGQLHNDGLVSYVEEIMHRYNINKGELEFEVTETAAMADAESAVDQMKLLRKTGVNFAIDDFGTGYSSLAYLKLFPIQTLKIDRAFVRDVDRDENDAAIAIATISLAHSLGLNVVAEGVETEEQRKFLEYHGCDVLQGYLFSRPLPVNEMTELLLKTLITS